MTVGLSTSGYNVYQKPGYTKKWTASTRRTAGVSEVAPAVSIKGNTCTDGVDDGKIGIFSAVGNIVEGAGKAFLNGLKGMFTDKDGKFSILKTLKSAAVVVGCGLCPTAGVILGGLGLAAGAVKFGSGVVRALNADTDVQAKDMWEQVGEGGLTVAVSAVGIKASLGAMKAAAGAESALASLKPNATFLEKVSAFGKDAVSSTKNNLLNFKSSFTNFFDKVKDVQKAKGALRDAKSALKEMAEGEPGRYQAETDYSYAEYELANAKDAMANTNIGRFATDAKNTVFHPFKTFKAFKASLKSNPVAEAGSATAEAGSAATSVFGKLTNGAKAAFNKLPSSAKAIWNKLCDPNTAYSSIVQEYGYTNVAEVLEVMANYGVIDSQM